ncbi:MAG: carboxylating nicotinate-nucleotide diphosphorylase [Methanobacterium sp.]|nr:carboxylating nicotinate-nucleotide diphosphorylase [Methanobacterium sp.]
MRTDINYLINIINQDRGFVDITTQALVEPGLNVKAKVISKEDGIIAGMDLVSTLLEEYKISILKNKIDGSQLKENEILLEMEGDARSILTLERSILNFLMRMSGIATLTFEMVKKARKLNPNIIIAGTRKTTPGLQFWEKEAIRIGGGDTHRYRLDDAILIKDNHLALVGDIETALKKAKDYASFTKKIEIEVENLEDALTAANAGADIIMLDNMDPNQIKKVLNLLNMEKVRDKVLIEVSGGINPDNISEYAETGVDIISSGYITHSAGVLDMSLEIE